MVNPNFYKDSDNSRLAKEKLESIENEKETLENEWIEVNDILEKDDKLRKEEDLK